MAAHQAPPSLGFSRQEHWSGLPFPSPMHESEKWSHSVVSDSSRPHGLQPTKLLRSWDFPGKSTGVGCHCLLHNQGKITAKSIIQYFSNWISEKPNSSSVSFIGMLQGETQTTCCIPISILSSFALSFLRTSITTKDSIWTKVLCQNKQTKKKTMNLT